MHDIRAGDRNAFPGDVIFLQGLASNGWAVTGRKSRSGFPLLANDFHLPFSLPDPFYLVHLQSPQINAAGFALPPLPGILAGRPGGDPVASVSHA